MLVLSRNPQTLAGDDRSTLVIRTPEGRVVEVTLVETRHGRARIGVTADPDVKVHRKELLRASRGETPKE